MLRDFLKVRPSPKDGRASLPKAMNASGDALRGIRRRVFRFERHFLEGPIDGQIQLVEAPGLDISVVWSDQIGKRAHHYQLVTPLPDMSKVPIKARYRHVAEFDPLSTYLQERGEENITEIEDLLATDDLPAEDEVEDVPGEGASDDGEEKDDEGGTSDEVPPHPPSN